MGTSTPSEQPQHIVKAWSHTVIGNVTLSYAVILWDDAYIEWNYDLRLWLGYDEDGQLVGRGRHWRSAPEESYEDSFATIECPWTFYPSVTAR